MLHFSFDGLLQRIDSAKLKREPVTAHLPSGGVNLVIATAQRAGIIFKRQRSRAQKSGQGNPSAFLAAVLRVILNDEQKGTSLGWRHRDREDEVKVFQVLVETISRPRQLARVAGPSFEGLVQAVDEARKLREQAR
jgi:hypothetical protein